MMRDFFVDDLFCCFDSFIVFIVMVHGDIGGVVVIWDVNFLPVLVSRYLFDISTVVYFDEVFSMVNINTVEAVDDAKQFYLDGKFGVDCGYYVS